MKAFFLFLSLCSLLYTAQVNGAAILESGIRVTSSAQAAIDTIKTGKEFRYGVFFVKNETAIDLETTGARSETYDRYLQKLKASKDCRYGLYDFEMQCKSSTTRDKLVLMSWCPDEVKVRSKFIHAASVEGMKKAVDGYSAFVQASDDEQASMAAVQEKLQQSVTPC